MIELEFSYTVELYLSLNEGDITINDFLEEATNDFSHDGFSEDDIIKRQLIAYHFDDGGSVEIDDYEIEEVQYEPTEGTGQVEISYEVQYFFGCADIDNTKEKRIKLTFAIDSDRQTLTFFFPEIQTRDTIDEF